MGKADLHTHTTFSDGALTPNELVERARKAGLAAVAITDHDTVDGVPEGIAAGRRLGVCVVPGVEINTDVPGSEVHMLGYFIDVESATLRQTLRSLRNGRLRRAEQIVERLQRIGVPVRVERVLELAGGDAAVGRPHVAQAVVESGFAAYIGDAFDKYLGQGKPAYVPRERFTPEQAIAAIRDAGGVPVLAHPFLSGRDDQVPHWVRAGMRGLETDYGVQADEQARHYRLLAQRLGLVATAGSDFHGLSGGTDILGARTCGSEVIERLEAEAACVRSEIAAVSAAPGD